MKREKIKEALEASATQWDLVTRRFIVRLFDQREICHIEVRANIAWKEPGFRSSKLLSSLLPIYFLVG